MFEKPLPWASFEQTMAVLTALRGPDLLRVKGLVAVEECRGPRRRPFRPACRPPTGRTRRLAGRRPPLAPGLRDPRSPPRACRAAFCLRRTDRHPRSRVSVGPAAGFTEIWRFIYSLPKSRGHRNCETKVAASWRHRLTIYKKPKLFQYTLWLTKSVKIVLPPWRICGKMMGSLRLRR
jgi:hypothetical protein